MLLSESVSTYSLLDVFDKCLHLLSRDDFLWICTIVGTDRKRRPPVYAKASEVSARFKLKKIRAISIGSAS